MFAFWRHWFPIGVGIFLSAASALAVPAQVNVRVLTELDPFEPFEAHLFHSDVLWVGSSRKAMSADYHLELFSADGSPLATANLVHSARYIYAAGDGKVLIVGVSGDPNQSHYTIATWNGKRLSLSHHSISTSAMADQAANYGGKWVFTDPGGMMEDLPPGQVFTAVPRTLFSVGTFGPRYWKTRIHGPSRPVVAGGALYVLETLNVMTGVGDGLLEVSPRDQSVAPVLAGRRHGLTNLLPVSQTILAATDSLAKQVLLVDLTRKQITTTISVTGGVPKPMALAGHCLAVGLADTKHVLFYDLNSASPRLVADWDLSVAGAKLFGLTAIAVDPKSGRLYARSAFPGNPMSPTADGARNSVVLAEEPSGETRRACGN